MKSWQIYSYANELSPVGFLQKIYKRSYPLVQSWAANPSTNEVVNRNPIDRITDMLAELKNVGREDVARAAVDIMARPLGGHFAFFKRVKSDKGTLDGEAADASIALGRLLETGRRAIADGAVSREELAEVQDKARLVRRELDEFISIIKEEIDEP